MILRCFQKRQYFDAMKVLSKTKLLSTPAGYKPDVI